MKYIFVADLFRDQILGGAECADNTLIDYLRSKGHAVECITCLQITAEHIKNNKETNFIVGNFVSLADDKKEALSEVENYIIYEHDHKYLKTRDPSVFPNFIAPPDQIVNKEFYKNAKAVFCLSAIHKKVLKDNLKINNVKNIATSLWSDDKLDYIKTLVNSPKTKKHCIVQSANPIKGTKEAIAFCESKNIEYDLISTSHEKGFLKVLSEYETLVFVPKVLETLSRLVVEAKMLNCNVITKGALIGAASEPWFDLGGEELINKIVDTKNNALKMFEEIFQENIEDITVILTCYRRAEYLTKQIEHIRNQTTKPKEIWIWVNDHVDNRGIDFTTFDVDRVFRNDHNWKFYGRFAAALLADTEYVAFFDDDTLPGSRWFENCMDTMEESPGILGGAGVLLKEDRYFGHQRVGWSSENEETTEVDLVGHAWFFRREWLPYLWTEKPFTWDNGEDIQFSYTAQKYGNIKTYCPPHPASDRALFSSLQGYQLGIDEKAESRVRNHEIFYKQRDGCVKNAIDGGWKPIYMREKDV